MATPSPVAAAVGPDTLVAIKVVYNDSNRRFKLPLRDMGARSFPNRLRQLLSIPADANVVFERFSDSGSTYVRLDSDNPSVYKQLFRAAKAKLKLRIRVSKFSESTREGPTSENSPVPKESPLKCSYLDTVLSQPLPPAPVEEPSLSVPAPDPVAGEMKILDPEALPTSEDPAPVHGSQLLFPVEKQASPSYVFSHLSPQGAFCIDCNNCSKFIPNAHYHCSICDGGDYDLCQACVDLGVSCPGEGHWLIKRFVKDGVVINSTTETVAPRSSQVEDTLPEKKDTDEPLPTNPSATVPPPAPAPPQNPEKGEERGCNGCFREFDETKMVTCTDCEDYDLCMTCLLKDAHGHHPGHTFALIHDGQFCLKSLVLSRCRPGRHRHHAAICDGCDKRILGVRHKCLACPDWDYCQSCFQDAARTHPGHRFAPIYEAIGHIPHEEETHYGIFCDGPLCRTKSKPTPTYISGTRYKCAVCYDTDFCAACEALPTNPHNQTHPLIKLRTSVRNVVVTTYSDNGLGGPPVTMGDTLVHEPGAPCDPKITHEPSEKPVERAESVKKEAEKAAQSVVKEPEQNGAENIESGFEDHTKKELAQQPPDFANADEETKSAVLAAAQASGYQAFFICDTIPTGTKLPPNHVFQQTWTLYNPGPLPWVPGSSIRFVSGDPMFNVDTDRPSSVTSITAAMESNVLSDLVFPGKQANFTVTLKTPRREGTAISYWRLKHPDGSPFGHKLWCEVRVTTDTIEPANVEPVVVTEGQTSSPRTDIQEECKLTESDMIFPKLEKESPIANSSVTIPPPVPAAPSAPSLPNVDEQDLLEDVESLTLEEDTTEGFLTDEEYDILDASDQGFLDAKQSHQ